MSKRRTPLFDRFSNEVFRSAQGWPEIVAGLSDVRLRDSERIHVLVVGSSESLPELLDARQQYGLRRSGRDGLPVYTYQRKFGRANENTVSGEFAVARPTDEPIYLLIAVEPSTFVRDGLRPLVQTLYPAAARPFLTQAELRRTLRSVQEYPEVGSLRILEWSARRRLSQPARKKYESLRDWTDVEMDTAFQEARQRNTWFRSVSFEVRSSSIHAYAGGPLKAKLSKYGLFECNGGFGLFNETILQPLVRTAADRLRFFSNRERTRTPQHVPLPIRLEYEAEVFKEPAQAGRFIEALRRFKHGTCTVLHGNPYVHAALVDSRDFSTADVWVLSTTEVLVVPQLRASEAALRRIVNHIFEEFAEGTISDQTPNGE